MPPLSRRRSPRSPPTRLRWGTNDVAALEVVLAIPGARDLAAARKAASTGEPIAAPQVDAAYFSRGANGIACEQIFLGAEWLEIGSPGFQSASGADAFDQRIVLTWRSAGG
jgi:hypothetical protein